MKRYSLKDIVISYDAKKRSFEKGVYSSRYLFRPLSYLPTYLLVNLGFSANAATWISLVFGIISLVLFCYGGYLPVLAACFFFFTFQLLDHVDGNIARLHGATNYYGKFLDSIVGVFVFGLLDFAVALGLTDTLWMNRQQVILVGALGTIVYFMTFIVKIRFNNLLAELAVEKGVPLPEKSTEEDHSSNTPGRLKARFLSCYRAVEFIDTNVMFFFLVCSAFFGFLQVYILTSALIRLILFTATFMHNVFLRADRLKKPRAF